MALESIKNINIDLYDDKYILINAKQYDDSSRKIYATCYNQGKILNINSNGYTVYIKYQKADGHFVFNFCTINSKGQIVIELTEQMLTASGTCYADLVIVEKGNAIVDVSTGEIITIDNSYVISTMNFGVYVYESPVDNSVIESSDEYDGLADLMKRAESEYAEVIQLSKSYAIGNASNIRENENYDNSKYYYEQAKNNSNSAEIYMNDASNSAKLSSEYMNDSLLYSQNAKACMNTAKTYMDNANAHMNTAADYKNSAKAHMDEANSSAENSLSYMNNTKRYMDNTKNNMDMSLENRDKSYEYAIASQRYAVGGTNTVQNEDIDNAKYYYEQLQSMRDSLLISTVDEVKDLLGI